MNRFLLIMDGNSRNFISFPPMYREISRNVSIIPTNFLLRVALAYVTLSIVIGLLPIPYIAQAEDSSEHFHYSSNQKDQEKAVSISNPKNNSSVGDDVTLLGRYSATMADDIWVIIWPEKNMGVGWPQYGNPQQGTSVKKNGNHWSVNAHFGDPPQSYEIAVYAASQSASSFLQQQFKQNTSGGAAYQGIRLSELPDGLIEHDRVVVQKDLKQSHSAQLMPLLKRIQSNLAKEEVKTGFTYYKDHYSKNEVYFWSEIAGWIVVDAINRHYTKGQDINQILDLGCGFGTLLAYATTIYGADGICLDILDNFGSYGINNFNVKYHLTHVQGDIERDSLPGEKQFNVIIMTEVMEHLNFQPVPTLKKIYNALAPGGSFFLSTPDADIGWGRNYKHYKKLSDLPALDEKAKWTDDHIWHYNTEELRRVLQSAGFTIKKFDHSYNPAKEGFGNFNVWLTK